MNGTLHHHHIYREGVERHQREAQAWAQAASLGRLARSTRPAPSDRGRHTRLSRHTRLIGVVAPMAALFTVMAILI